MQRLRERMECYGKAGSWRFGAGGPVDDCLNAVARTSSPWLVLQSCSANFSLRGKPHTLLHPSQLEACESFAWHAFVKPVLAIAFCKRQSTRASLVQPPARLCSTLLKYVSDPARRLPTSVDALTLLGWEQMHSSSSCSRHTLRWPWRWKLERFRLRLFEQAASQSVTGCERHESSWRDSCGEARDRLV